MVTQNDYDAANAASRPKVKTVTGEDVCPMIRIHYSGPREGAMVEGSASVLVFYHYTQSSKFTKDPAVGMSGILQTEQSNSGVATVSKAGQLVSLINAATYWEAWLDGARYDTSCSADFFKKVTYGTASVSSSEFGCGVLYDTSVQNYHQIGIGYMDRYTDAKGGTSSGDAANPVTSNGDVDWQKQGVAEIDDVQIFGDTTTGSTVQATLTVMAQKVEDTGVVANRTVWKASIPSLNNATAGTGLGNGKNFLDKATNPLKGRPGERLIVRLETGGSLGIASINVSGKWTPNPITGQ